MSSSQVSQDRGLSIISHKSFNYWNVRMFCLTFLRVFTCSWMSR